MLHLKYFLAKEQYTPLCVRHMVDFIDLLDQRTGGTNQAFEKCG